MEAPRQDVGQEPPDKLVGLVRHHALTVGTVAAVILDAEGHPILVEGDEVGFEMATRWV
jgi:hypothetical protein